MNILNKEINKEDMVWIRYGKKEKESIGFVDNVNEYLLKIMPDKKKRFFYFREIEFDI